MIRSLLCLSGTCSSLKTDAQGVTYTIVASNTGPSDVTSATVTDTFAERSTLARLNGEPAVTMVVSKTLDSNAIDLVEE